MILLKEFKCSHLSISRMHASTSKRVFHVTLMASRVECCQHEENLLQH